MANKMYDSWQFGVEWSGVEWSGVEWSVSQSLLVSQSVRVATRLMIITYTLDIILPPPLEPIKLKQGSSTPHKILKTNLHQG